jgi:hypothetical protein
MQETHSIIRNTLYFEEHLTNLFSYNPRICRVEEYAVQSAANIASDSALRRLASLNVRRVMPSSLRSTKRISLNVMGLLL